MIQITHKNLQTFVPAFAFIQQRPIQGSKMPMATILATIATLMPTTTDTPARVPVLAAVTTATTPTPPYTREQAKLATAWTTTATDQQMKA